MKSLKLAVLAIGLVGVFGVGNVMALPSPISANILVSAKVVPSCVITKTLDIAFGDIDPLATLAPYPAPTPGSVNVKCTNLATVAFSASNIVPMTAAGYTINYVPDLPGGTPVPTVGGTDYPISAKINTQSEITGAPAGTYNGNFDVVITY